MKISDELLEQIRARHAEGQSDPAIALWLASLKPCIYVTADAVRKARGRPGKDAPAKTSAEIPPIPAKSSGAENRRRIAQRSMDERADHEKRDPALIDVEAEKEPLFGHLYAMKVEMAIVNLIIADPLMTLPEKSRHLAMHNGAIAKLKTDAENQRRVQVIIDKAKRKDLELQAREQEIALEEKRLKSLRGELEAREEEKK